MTQPPVALKSILRRQLRDRRDAAPPQQRQLWAEQIVKTIADRLLDITHQCIAAYLPLGSEVDIRPVLPVLISRGGVVALPVTHADTLIFRAWTPGERLVSAGFGTLGPDTAAPALDPDTLLIPLLGYDRTGTRLGYGRGYYDRAIAGLCRTKNLTLIGIAFSLQEVENIPREAHDASLHSIITEKETIVIG